MSVRLLSPSTRDCSGPGQKITLAPPEWAGGLTDADRRGITPIFHTTMTLYGEIQLRTDRRLDLAGLAASGGS
ncbi:hypothetical protein AB0B25_16895 [Nocardia sp. NPDC049190]|uniref:hypothetical protein n=1 Tax=Nocardia sp. NPDC049190 TaxID=3155650 RepID=UPI0033E7B7E7